MRSLLARLDAYGTDDPDFNEGFPEDRCPVAFCGRPVDEHPLWKHRIAALVNMFLDRRERRAKRDG